MEPHINCFDRLSDDLLECIFEKLLWNPNAFGIAKGRERVRLESVCKRFQEQVHTFGSLDWEFQGPQDEEAFLKYIFRQSSRATPLTRVALDVRSSVNVTAILQSVILSTQGSLQELHLFVGILPARCTVKWEYVFLLLTAAQQLRSLDLFLWGREQLVPPLRLHVPSGAEPLAKLSALTLYGFAIPGSECDQFLKSFPSLRSLELHSFAGQTFSFGVNELEKVFVWGNEGACFDLRNSASACLPSSLEKVIALMNIGSLATRQRAVSVMLSLAKNAKNKKAIAAFPGSLHALVQLLDIGSVPAALATLQMLADEPENTKIIGQVPGCLQKLLSLLEHYHQIAHEPAAEMLVKFARVAEVGRDMAGDPELLQRLVKLLDFGKGRAPVLAGWVLLHLADDGDVKASACEETRLLKLVALLEGASVSMRVGALLKVLCNDIEMQKSVTSTPTFLHQLVGLLASKRVELQSAAAEALHNMARDDADRKVMLAVPECLDFLLKIVGEGEGSAPEKAAMALWKLAAGEPPVCDRVAAKPGALQMLVSRLGGESDPVQQQIVGLLATLARDSTARQAMAMAPGCLSALVSLMKDERAEVRRNVCGTLWLMGNDRAVQNEVLKVPEVAPRLVDLISEGMPSVVVEAAVGALQSMAGRSVVREAIVNQPGCLQRLVNLLGFAGRTPKLAAFVFAQLVAHAHMRKVVVELPGAVEQLVGLLGVGGSKGAHDPAARALHSLAKSRECRVPIGAVPGCLGKLVGFLMSREEHLQREAEKLLQSLLVEPEVKQLAATTLLCKRLVNFVERGRGSAPERAAGVLWQMAAHDAQIRATAEATVVEGSVSRPGQAGEASEEVQKAAEEEGETGAAADKEKGFLVAVTTFLRDGSIDVRKSVAKALWDTGNHDSTVRKAALQVPCLVPTLLDLLSEGHGVPVKEAAAGALQSIGQDPEVRSVVASTPGCLERLGELLESDEGRVSELAAFAISQLAADENRRKGIMELPGAVEKLVGLLDVGGPGGPHKPAVSALRSLVWDKECRLAVAAMPGCLEKLARLLWAEKELVQREAAEVLFGMTVVSDTRPTVWYLPGLLDQLVALLSSSSPAVQASAARVLQNLALDEEPQVAIASVPGCLEKLYALLESKCPFAAEQSVMLLWDLTGDDETRNLVFKEAGLLEKAAGFLDPAVRFPPKAPAGLLLNFAAGGPENRKALVSVPGFLEHLVCQLAGKDPMHPTWLLIDLAVDAEIREAFIAVPGFVQKLIELLTRSSMRELALDALQTFAVDPGFRTAIAAVPDFVSRLKTLAGLPRAEKIQEKEDRRLRRVAAKVLELLGLGPAEKAPSDGAAGGSTEGENAEGPGSVEKAESEAGSGEKAGSRERVKHGEGTEGAETAEGAGSGNGTTEAEPHPESGLVDRGGQPRS